MYAALMSQPAPAAPPKWHQRMGRGLVRWPTLLLAIAVWLSVNAIASIYWPFATTPVIAEGKTWSAQGVSVQFNQAFSGTTITLPDQDPVHATSGAIFIAIIFNYTLASATTDPTCQLLLQGNHRTWTPDMSTQVTISDLTAGTEMDGTQEGCSPQSGNSGTFGAIYQVPKSALSEITGVQITVATPDLNINRMFRRGSQTALLAITIKPPS